MSRSEKKSCKLCSLKPYFLNDGTYVQYESSVLLADGGWTAVRACKDKDGFTGIYAVGDDYSEMYYPHYCPECGKKINDVF